MVRPAERPATGITRDASDGGEVGVDDDGIFGRVHCMEAAVLCAHVVHARIHRAA